MANQANESVIKTQAIAGILSLIAAHKIEAGTLASFANELHNSGRVSDVGWKSDGEILLMQAINAEAFRPIAD